MKNNFKCAFTNEVELHKLVPHPKNPNKHPKEQIERLAKIIDYQGQRAPIVVSKRSGFITKGHGRLEALKFIKWDKAAVDYQDYDDEAQEYADIVADNAISSWAELQLADINQEMLDLGPDFDIDLLGIKDFVIEPTEKFEAQSDEDEVPEVDHPITRKGDIWILGNHRLMCGDSTMIDDVEKLMNGEKADMVFTDPPYGISIVKGSNVVGSKPFGKVGGGKIVAANNYAPIAGDDTIDVAVEAIQIINILDPKVQIIWGGNYYANKLENSSCWIVWDKQNSGNFADCELAWTNQKTAVRMFTHMWNGMIKASEHNQKRVHPTQKPVALAEWCFKEYGEDCVTILDLFAGGGFTVLAGEKLGKKTFNMELSEHYCDVIINRWQNYTGKKAVLEATGQTYEELKEERDGDKA